MTDRDRKVLEKCRRELSAIPRSNLPDRLVQVLEGVEAMLSDKPVFRVYEFHKQAIEIGLIAPKPKLYLVKL